MAVERLSRPGSCLEIRSLFFSPLLPNPQITNLDFLILDRSGLGVDLVHERGRFCLHFVYMG